ncbi:ADP-heptose--LPS heptosyltransferase RfaF [Flavobacteriales bacterium 33_180_T64]|nr:ADP-heptose--LPS heptosyltransferase RfaF [Flavobacteriales bacterium 33_180_T64]
MPKTIKHILVIRLSAMGDVAMTVPVLRAFIEQNPDIKITVLTREFFIPIFRDLAGVSVFTADLKNTHKGILGLYKLSKAIKKLNIDAVADLHNVLRSQILKRFLKGSKWAQINKGRIEKKALISGKTFSQLKSTHQRYADVFEALGFKINLSNPSFPSPHSFNESIESLIGNSEEKRIGIAPFAAHEGKMYPLVLMEQVIETLSTSHHVILFGGGKTEQLALDVFEEKFENVTNVTGKLSFEEELDVIGNLSLMISMDSGNAHLAAMHGVNTLTIWGVTHPFAGFYPFNQDVTNGLLANRDLYQKIPTSVYGKTYPEGYQNAIKTITPEQIINKVNKLL